MDLEKELLEQDIIREDHVLIIAVVDSAYAEDALKATEARGAAGGIIVHGRGKNVAKKASVFGVSLNLSRDLVMIAAHQDRAFLIQESIFEAVGLKTEGHGIVYQLPISSLNGFVCGRVDEITESSGPPGTIDKGGSG